MQSFLNRHKERLRFLKPLWAAYRAAFAALPWRWLPGTSEVFGPPRGLHTRMADYRASGAADPRDRTREVAAATSASLALPRSLEPAAPWKFRRCQRLELAPWRVHELHAVRFWGDYAGTLIGRDDHVLGELTIDVWEPRRHRIFTRLKLPPCRRLPGTTAVLAAAEADTNYWHWTMDVLPRLEALRQAGWPVESVDWFVVNHRDLPFQRETLEERGIPWEKVVRADARLHVACECAITTSLRSQLNTASPAECAALNTAAARRWPDARPHRRLFLSREGAAFRRLTNEAEVLAQLVPLGFEKLRCAQYSVAEQQRLFREADCVVGPHGAAFTNIVYAQPGLRVLEFMAPRYIDPTYWFVASHLRAEHWVLIGDGVRPPEGVDPLARQEDITVDPGLLAGTLREMKL